MTLVAQWTRQRLTSNSLNYINGGPSSRKHEACFYEIKPFYEAPHDHGDMEIVGTPSIVVEI